MTLGEELVGLSQRLRTRDLSAWEELYALTHLPLLRLLRRMLRDDQQAEEALQGTYVTAIERFDQYDCERGSVDAWLAGIARNKAREAWRRPQMASCDPDLFDSGQPGVDDSDAEAVALALDELEPRYAEVLRRKYLVGESIAQIARELKLKPATVGTLLHRGREKFKASWERLTQRVNPVLNELEPD